MQRTNTITKPVAGVNRSFRFGVGFWAALSELRGGLSPADTMLVVLAATHPAYPDFLRSRGDLLYCGALNYVETEGQQQDFTRAQALEWLGQMEQADHAAVATVAYESTHPITGKSAAEVVIQTQAAATPAPKEKRSRSTGKPSTVLPSES